MPYFSYRTEKVKNALIGYHGGLSFENCALCLNISGIALYRLICSFGKYSMPDILHKTGIALPKNVQADEKHTQCLDQKGYIPLLTCGHAIWHIDYVDSLDDKVLEDSYRKFSEETRVIDAHYTPTTITHDGFQPTIKALSNIFKKTTFLICWLHACWSLFKLLRPFSKEVGAYLSWKLFKRLKKYNKKDSLQCISLKNWFTAILRKYKHLLPNDLYDSLKKWIKRK